VNDTEPLLLSVAVVGDVSAAPHATELALAAATTARQSTSLTPPPLLQFKRGDVNPTVGGSSAVESRAKPPTHASRRCSLDEKGASANHYIYKGFWLQFDPRLMTGF
jgi:hypothetical protein